MKSFRFYNVALILLFCIGASGSVGAILYPKKHNFFKDLAPLPIIFSLGRYRQRTFYDTHFIIITKDGQKIKKEFNKDLYRYIEGPHRRKIFLHSMLRWQKGIDSNGFNKLLLSFCNQRFSFEFLQTQELPKKITAGWTNLDKTVSVMCP